jgi:hypothetical protein
MEFQDMKIAVVIAWAIVWSIIAVTLVSSASHWLLLVGAGVLPPLTMVQLWHPLAKAVPAVIHQARG